MLRLIPLLLLLLTLSSTLSAQAPDTLWTATFGGGHFDIGACIGQCNDGGFIIAGSYAHDDYNSDFWLIKTDETGTQQWSHTYGGLNLDLCHYIAMTNDGGCIIVGQTYTFGGGCDDVWLIKTDANGDSLWSRVYGGALWDRGYCVQQTMDGGYIIIGETQSYGAGDRDAWLIRTDSTGDTLWTRTFGGGFIDVGEYVLQCEDGSFLIAGYSDPTGTGNFDVWLFRVDNDGDLLWNRTYGGGNDEKCACVQGTNDGGYIVAGQTASFGVGLEDVWLLRTDSQGDSLWSHAYGGTLTDMAYCVQQTADEGYIIAGCTWSEGNGGSDMWFIRTDDYGVPSWYLTCGGAQNDACQTIRIIDDEGYIAIGNTESYGVGEQDAYLVRIDSDPPGVKPTKPDVPLTFVVHPPYPNPFNPSTTITFNLQVAGKVKLDVFDVEGRHVRTLREAPQNPGIHMITFDGSGLKSGVYLFHLTTPDFASTGKMVLMK